jgi:hypothetical protein
VVARARREGKGGREGAWERGEKVWCGPGVVLTFYRHRGSAGEVCPGGGLTVALMSLTPLKTTRLRGGLRMRYGWWGELRLAAANRGTELGGTGWPSVTGFSGAPLDRER